MRRIRTADDEFQQLRALLTNRSKRHRGGRLLVQGVRPIDQALAHGWEVRALLRPAGREPSRWAAAIAGAHAAAESYELAPELFAELAGKEEPADLLAVVALPRRRLADLRPGERSVVLVLDRPSAPGNVGTIVRSADAFGAFAVVTTGHAADPFDPRSVRASTGSVFALPVVTAASIAEVADWVAASWPGAALLGTDESGEPLDRAPLSAPLALVLGNETSGLSRTARERCDRVVGVPIRGSASSLNVATAAGILLYEIDRRRR